MASALKRAAEVAGTSKPSQEPAPEAETTHAEAASPATPSWGTSQGAAAAPAPAKEPTPAAKTIEFKAPVSPVPPVEEETPAPRQFEAPTFSTLAVKDHEQPKAESEKKSPFLWVAIAAIVVAGSYFGWTKFHSSASPAPNAPTQSQAPVPLATQPSATVIATPLPPTSTEAAASPVRQRKAREAFSRGIHYIREYENDSRSSAGCARTARGEKRSTTRA